LCETFYPKFLRNSQKGVKVILGDIDLPMIHEVEHALHVSVSDALQIEDQRSLLIGWLVSSQDGAKEWTAGGEDHFVGLQLLILAGNGDIEKFLLVPDVSECRADISFKIVPT